jgi:hypothetical protein
MIECDYLDTAAAGLDLHISRAALQKNATPRLPRFWSFASFTPTYEIAVHLFSAHRRRYRPPG